MNKSSFLDFFEIKRPVKSSLKNSCSASNIDSIADEDEIRTKERLFVRNAGTIPKSRSSKRYRKKTSSTRNEDNREMSDEIYEAVPSVKSLTKKFESIIETQQVRNEFRRSQSFIATSEFMSDTKSNMETTNQETITESHDQEASFQKPRTQSETVFNEIDKKERRKNIRSFAETETEEEKETYRQQLLEQMDEKFEKMKMDGFVDDYGLIVSEEYDDVEIEQEVTEILDPNALPAQEGENHVYHEDSTNEVTNYSYGMFTNEEVYESLGDDLEHGSFVVEAYNDDGRELIIVQISIDRKAVNLNSLQSIKEVMEESDIVFYENENRTLSTVSDPEDLIMKNGNSMSEEPVYEEISVYESKKLKRFSAPLPNGHNEDTEYCEVFYDQNSVQTRSKSYSAVSNQSSPCEEDEGIGNSYDNVYGSVRRETFCDNQGNIRIERIGYPEKNGESGDEAATSLSRNNSITPSKRSVCYNS